MGMKIRYICPDQGDTIDDAITVNQRWYPVDLKDIMNTNIEIFAEAAAEQYFNENDGWEADWPQKIAIYTDDLYLGTCLVEREDHPVFIATVLKTKE